MMKRRTFKQPLILALSLLAVAAGTAWVVLRSERAASALEQKFQESERLLCYVLRERAPAPRFLLSGRERRLRLITHAVLPPGLPFDAEHETVYGIRFTLNAANGQKLWQRDVYQKSRQTKAQHESFGFRFENAFVPDLKLELNDDRLLEVDLPRDTPPQSTLTLSPLGAVPEVLVRVYKRTDRVPLAGPPAVASMTPQEREGVALRLVRLPWDRLQRAEQDQILKYKWRRMSAEGQESADFVTRVIYYSGIRLSRAQLRESELTPVWPSNDAAFNVRGPAKFELTLALDPLSVRTGAVQRVEIERRSTTGDVQSTYASLPGQATEAASWIEVPAGVHTLVVRSRGDSALRVGLSTQQSAPPQPWLDASPEQQAQGIIVPDVQRIRSVIVQPTGPSVQIAFDRDADLLARTLRLDVRVPIPSGHPESGDFNVAEAGRTTLTLIMRDERGATVRRLEVPILAARSRFEKALSSNATMSDITEPFSLHTIVPSGVTMVEVVASNTAHLRLLTLTEEPNELDTPYLDFESESMLTRYATHLRRTYWPFLPDNYLVLSEQGRTGSILAQVRLEPLGVEAHSSADLDTRSVLPAGRPESHTILEPVGSDRQKAFLGEWGTGSVTELTRGRSTPLIFGRTHSLRASLSFTIAGGQEAASLGKPVSVRIDGRNALDFELRETRGSVTLPVVSPGPHRIEVTTPAERVRWHIDRPPANPGGVALYRKRRVFDLRPGRTLRVDAQRRAGPAAQLYMIVYARAQDGLSEPQFRVRIDSGNPRRVQGAFVQALTRSERSARLGQPYTNVPAEFIDVRGQSAGYPRQLLLGFGDDLEVGPHRVEITNIGTTVAWARFFEVGVSSRIRERAVQRMTTVDDAGDGK